jgi:hypothetical protein
MAERGVPMAALQRIAGHSSIQITAQYYLHVSPETRQETFRALEGLDKLTPGPWGNASKTRVEPVGDVENAVGL